MEEQTGSFDTRLAQEVSRRISLLREQNPGESFDAMRDLPLFYRLLWRLAFDTSNPRHLRHYAGSLAFYVHTRVDYISEDTGAAGGFMDDLAVTSAGIQRLITELGEGRLTAHWKGDAPLDESLSRASDLVSRYLPGRAADKVEAYIAF